MPTSDISVLKKRFATLSKTLSPLPTHTEPVLQPLKDIRFVIFDFYGTLFISGVGDIGIDEDSQSTSLFTEVLEACGYESNPEVAGTTLQYFDDVVGLHKERLKTDGYDIPEPAIDQVWLDVLKKLHRVRLIRGDINLQNARKFAVEFELRMNPIWPMPGLNELLEGLRSETLETGIISNSQFYTPLAFEALMGQSITEMGFNPKLLHWSFEEQLKKPSLTFYNGFLDRLKSAFPGANPAQVLYTGNDMLKDIYPAAKLGMRTALFAGDKRSLKWRRDDERCQNITPDLVITKLSQIPPCIA